MGVTFLYKISYNKNNKKFSVYKKINEKKVRLVSSISKSKLFNKLIKCAHTLFYVFSTKKEFIFFGAFALRDQYDLVKPKKIHIRIETNRIPIKEIFSFYLPLKKKTTIVLYYCKIPFIDFIGGKIHNRVVVSYKDQQGCGFDKPMRYNFFQRKGSGTSTRAINILEDLNSSIFVRQSIKNDIFITCRNINKTDEPRERFKLFLAYYVAKIVNWKNVKVLFEKECSKYEESASVVFEKLIDQGYKNTFFILKKEFFKMDKIDPRYRRYFVRKYSFKHYFLFFRAYLMLATETPYHGLELRTVSKYVHKKISRGNFDYVFLQHGISFNISFGSASRKIFRKGNLFPPQTKFVVSSKVEGDHFVDYAGFDYDDLLITGMPKFDRNVRYDHADKIIFMPTWRPWEFNEVRLNYKETAYYKMMVNIKESIPGHLQEKLVLLPHPLFYEFLKDSDLKKYLIVNQTYDEILREARILITDYSSIAFDAFSRGTNVIFWWKDKEECMSKYNGFLMLNEQNIFGDICYSIRDFPKTVNENYKMTQSDEYLERYQKIVEFSDKRNTERLINELKIKDILY